MSNKIAEQIAHLQAAAGSGRDRPSDRQFAAEPLWTCADAARRDPVSHDE